MGTVVILHDGKQYKPEELVTQSKYARDKKWSRAWVNQLVRENRLPWVEIGGQKFILKPKRKASAA